MKVRDPESELAELLSRVESREPQLFRGFLWMAGSILLLGAIIKVFSYLPSLVSKPVAGLAGLGAALMIRKGKRLWQPTLREQMEQDPRPPILYFRSFAVDTMSKASARRISLLAMMGNYSYLGTYEEMLTPVCRLAGPFVAIGEPHELQVPLGATRIYCRKDAEWKEIVELLLRNAAAAVFAIDSFYLSEATKWEVNLATKLLSPSRIFIIATSAAKLPTPPVWRPNGWEPDPNVIDSGAIERFSSLFSAEQGAVEVTKGGAVFVFTDNKLLQVIEPVRFAKRKYNSDPLADALGRGLQASGLITAPPWYRFFWNPIFIVASSIGTTVLIVFLVSIWARN